MEGRDDKKRRILMNKENKSLPNLLLIFYFLKKAETIKKEVSHYEKKKMSCLCPNLFFYRTD